MQQLELEMKDKFYLNREQLILKLKQIWVIWTVKNQELDSWFIENKNIKDVLDNNDYAVRFNMWNDYAKMWDRKNALKFYDKSLSKKQEHHTCTNKDIIKGRLKQ